MSRLWLQVIVLRRDTELLASRRTTFLSLFPDLALSASAGHPIRKDRTEKTATLKPRQTKCQVLLRSGARRRTGHSCHCQEVCKNPSKNRSLLLTLSEPNHRNRLAVLFVICLSNYQIGKRNGALFPRLPSSLVNNASKDLSHSHQRSDRPEPL